MRILFLTQIIPYPPDSGPKVKTWHVLRYLVDRGHQVILVSFTRPEEAGFVPVLRKMCSEVHPISIHRSRIQDIGFWLRSQLTGRPFLIERDDLKAMRHCVQEILASYQIDVIHADQLTMTQFALPVKLHSNKNIGPNNVKNGGESPRVVFDAHNAVWTIVNQMAQNVPWYLKPVLQVEARRVKRYEGMVVDKFDHILSVTDVDSHYLKEAQATYRNKLRPADETQKGSAKPVSILTVPIAVDTEVLQPIQRKRGSKKIFTLGTLHYPPNADGIRWLVREVFPLVKKRIPKVTLTIAGRNPPADFHQFSEESKGAITITGYVPDLPPLLEESAIIVVPVRAGSGMRVRILEAFAQAMPVVTTTIGLEGIDAQPDKDVLIGDTPQDFAASVIRLLDDDALQAQLAANGRYLAEHFYDWKVILNRMEKIYGPRVAVR
ncbi:MAG TPA: glycosyltransferase family 4 protein [Anaerolineales bacterium]|nr:glycosyltransferase family 4 protein [Anaerolineales bacterium]